MFSSLQKCITQLILAIRNKIYKLSFIVNLFPSRHWLLRLTHVRSEVSDNSNSVCDSVNVYTQATMLRSTIPRYIG